MYKHFTDRIRKVLALATQEAIRFNNKHIGTEHLLLGLLREGTGNSAYVLRSLGIDLSGVRRMVEKEMRPGLREVTTSKLARTPLAKRAIESAVKESRDLGHNYVGTEHLLLGLTHRGGGIASTVLESLGLTPEIVRQKIMSIVGGRSNTRPDLNWTVDLKTKQANSSPEFLRIVFEVAKLMRKNVSTISAKRAESAARQIMAELAHKQGLAPYKTTAE